MPYLELEGLQKFVVAVYVCHRSVVQNLDYFCIGKRCKICLNCRGPGWEIGTK